MTKLKLGPLPDNNPVKVTLELSATLNRDLIDYAEVLARETGQPAADPVRLIVPMLERFIATDRGFAKARRVPKHSQGRTASDPVSVVHARRQDA